MGQVEFSQPGEAGYLGGREDPVYEANLKRFLEGGAEERQFGYLIPVDMLEQEDQVLVLADLPGLSLDEVSVSLSGRVLTIEGRYPEAGSEGRVFFRERCSGPVKRSIVLPAGVAGARYSLELNHGLLKVCIPHREP